MQGTLTILGCGSALPTFQNSPSGQLLQIADKAFLIDCGEGTQLTMRRLAIRTSRLYSIFISHLHGDHCFGLMGLISTFGMMGRLQPLHIYAHPDLEKLLSPWIQYHCSDLSYEIIFHHINPRKNEVVFEDRTVRVTTIPLKHKVPCCGFLFTERHRRKSDNGEFYIEERKRYAYCSDTMYSEKIIPLLDGVENLFHETTYTEEHSDKCKATMHSTASQAATIALKANVGRLFIGHYSARVDNHRIFLEQAQSVFPNTVMAEEKQTYDI